MKHVLFISCICAAGVWASAPSVSITSTTFDGRQVIVSYDLSGEPAIVTATFDVDGATVGADTALHLAGDANKVVDTGARTICWRPDKDLGNVSGGIVPHLTVWATNAPPDYMVVDMSSGGIRYYTSTNTLPEGGLANDLYRTQKMVLRRIPAAGVTWWMGTPSNESGRTAAYETRHKVKFTKDYYLGIYEVTQRQCDLVKITGTHTNYFTNATCSVTRPADGVAWNWIRGVKGTAGCRWPESDGVADVSFMGILRARTGKTGFDLPTEAEWEYACRAGTAEARYDMGDYARIARKASVISRNVDLSGGTAKVGSYLPNAWGLYDMIGNVWEWCLDYFPDRDYDTSSDVTEDPKGATPGLYDEMNRVRRGGAYNTSDTTKDFRSGRRSYRWSTNGWQHSSYQGEDGFRVAFHF